MPSRDNWNKRDDLNSQRFNETILMALQNLNHQLSNDEQYSIQDRKEMKKGLAASDLAFIFGFREANPARPWPFSIREELIALGRFDPTLVEYLSKVKRPDQEIWNRCRTLLDEGVITAKKSDSRGIRRRKVIHYSISKDKPMIQENPLRAIEKLKGYGKKDCKVYGTVTVFGLSDWTESRIEPRLQEELVERANSLALEFHDAWERSNEIQEGDYVRMGAEAYFGRESPIDKARMRHLAFPIVVIDPNDMMRLSKKEAEDWERVWRRRLEEMGKPADAES